MAILIPEQSIIDKQKVSPTPGEQYLINFLVTNLNDEYEIYYQPYLNGKNPDVILMRRGGGILIIEVKDWSLSNYYIDGEGDWRLLKNDAYIQSPLAQVEGYKDKIYNLSYRFLYENMINRDVYGVIRTAVYFHNENREYISKFISNENYIKLIGRNNMNVPFWHSLLNELYLSKRSRLFNDELYFSIKRYLKPSFHQSEIGKEIHYSNEQKVLTISEVKKRQKIKGCAGSGKTLVLARRAVNAHLRTNDKVLILTFNLSLVNYIHDQISNVRENFAWKNFYITNYHTFLKNTPVCMTWKLKDMKIMIMRIFLNLKVIL
ncbi:NERD domain-containing protein [Rodentibacter haemolyticus]|uniref:NERD domain-containing protein n=1 Tax=Rodentibacter haemolyticus TaxID=2778911 RepID=UPI001E597000|nr:nuclease-related domain-containing protein [Rodentibacter haemolyticus]